jgi:hypothetical protein
VEVLGHGQGGADGRVPAVEGEDAPERQPEDVRPAQAEPVDEPGQAVELPRKVTGPSPT